MPTASTVGKNIRNQRKGDHPKAPKTLSELGLPPIHTNSGEDFIMYDSGLDPTNRIIMFSNEKSLDFLVKCEVLHMEYGWYRTIWTNALRSNICDPW